MKLPLLAPISQAISPGRRCRLMTANSARWSRSRAFSARVRNRILSVVNQAWKMDTGQPSACATAPLRLGIRLHANPAWRSGPSTLSLRSSYAGHCFGLTVSAWLCAARKGEAWWGKKDSNLRSHKTADLQSAPFATRDTPPFNPITGPSAEMATDKAMVDAKTGHRWRAPGRAVYGGINLAKSTNAGR